MHQAKSRIHADPNPQPDLFDSLPDPLLLLILNKVSEIRSLGRCSAVSKRFNSLVPFVQDIFIKIDRVVTVDGSDPDEPALNPKPRNFFASFIKMFLYIIKPFQRGNNNNSGGARSHLFPQISSHHHSPAQVLRNFCNVRNLRIELPGGDVGTEEGVLLRWRAEFGCTLQNCVILGGTRVDKKPNLDLESPNLGLNLGLNPNLGEDNGSMPESFYTNGGLKLRVVWTISSLIAASTRHYLLRQIIKDHQTLINLVLTDADGQGTLIMRSEQLKEFRENQLACSASSNRTQVPACNMKLRYCPSLDLPGNFGLQGATLVVIKPSCEGSNANVTSGNNKKENEGFVNGAFDGVFKVAVKALMKRRTYLLEMNGF